MTNNNTKKDEEIKKAIHWKIQTATKDELNDYIRYIWSRQTAEEQNSQETKEKNNRGLNAYDAKFVGGIVKQIEGGRELTIKQSSAVKKCLKKYWQQYRELFTEDDLLTEFHNIEEEPKEARGEEEKKSQSQILIDLAIANSSELISDQYEDTYVVIPAKYGGKCLRLKSNKVKIWLSRLYYQTEGKGVSKEAIHSAVNTLAGIALFDGRRVYLWNRVAFHNGKVYYEIADEDEHVIEIDERGWRVVEDSPVLFRSEQHQKPQVLPQKGGSIEEFWEFFPFSSERDKVLFVCSLVSYLIPDINHPVDAYHGQHGSRKTTVTAYTKELIDPSKSVTQRLPKDENNLVLALFHHWLCAFDNEGVIKDWQSDILSRAVTGAGEQKRQLYTDEDEVIFNYKRCILINGILIPIQRPDIMDRAILFKLERRDDNRSEKRVYERFTRTKSLLFGALLDLLSKTLKIWNAGNIQIPGHVRLYDFAEIGEACTRALGLESGRFLEFYMQSKAEDNLEVLNNTLMGAVLLDLVTNGVYKDEHDEEVTFLDENERWIGTPSELLRIFNLKALELKIDRRSIDWKGSPEGLSKELTKLRTNFKAVGIVVEDGRTALKRYINVYRTPQPTPYSMGKTDTPVTSVIEDDTHDSCDTFFHTVGVERDFGISDKITDSPLTATEGTTAIKTRNKLPSKEKISADIQAATRVAEKLGLKKEVSYGRGDLNEN